MSAVTIEGLHKSFGKNEVLRGIDLDVAEHEVVCLIGASGSGKSTLLRCVNLLEPVDAWAHRRPGRGDHGARRRRQPDPARDRDRLPGLQPLPAHERARQRHARPAEGARHAAAAGGSGGDRAARALRPRRQARRLSRPALRRPAAAGRDRARARAQAGGDAARRGDERARPGARRRGAERDPRARGRRDDDADRDPRDGASRATARAASASSTRASSSSRARPPRSSARRPSRGPASSSTGSSKRDGCRPTLQGCSRTTPPPG